jgi:hypothetical protein
MLTTENVFSIAHEAYRLCHLPNKSVGRKLRRFLEQSSAKGRKLRPSLGQSGANAMVTQSFAYEQGHTPEQLKALCDYALHLAVKQELYLEKSAVSFQGLVFDASFSLVSNHYQLKHDIATATVAQLRDMVKAIAVLSESMQAFAGNPNTSALSSCPDYVYRNTPCSITDDENLWCVAGHDVRGNSGVLEWCYDKADAKYLLTQMQRFPERFKDISASKFAESQLVCGHSA